ncbi:hypothetical protein [Streptomyces sp. NBC_01361]|uniref:hypothetical protein n=1 Tax=Streptomyces sp. NBC_01361 TaxID=2903838 RepID=UPI002E303DD5|nr:hypothetical protein [Streptomyces sp. NBC_01361]
MWSEVPGGRVSLSVAGSNRPRRRPARSWAARARSLAVCAPDDHYSLPSLAKFAAALDCETRVLSDGHVAAPEQLPAELARTVLEWVDRG